MATKVTQSWDGEVFRDGLAPARGKTFMVTFSANASPEAACRAPRIPRRGDALAGSDLVVTDVEARPLGPMVFEITVTYGQQTGESQENPIIIAPWDRQWSISVGNQSESVAYDVDMQGRKVVNSTGAPFDPPDQREVTDTTITVVRNHRSFNLEKAHKYNNAYNSDKFLDQEPFSVRVNITGEYQQEEKWIFWRVTYALRFRSGEAGWNARVADRGFQEKIGVKENGKPELAAILDRDGNPVSEPQLLDGKGRAAKDGAETTWLTFRRYPHAAFAALGLEANIRLALAGQYLTSNK